MIQKLKLPLADSLLIWWPLLACRTSNSVSGALWHATSQPRWNCTCSLTFVIEAPYLCHGMRKVGNNIMEITYPALQLSARLTTSTHHHKPFQIFNRGDLNRGFEIRAIQLFGNPSTAGHSTHRLKEPRGPCWQLLSMHGARYEKHF
jgi:hypothetical protein